MHLVDFSLGWLKHVEPPSHPKNYGSSICTRSFWAFRAFSSDGDSNMNVIKPGSHEIPQNHVSRSLIFSKCYRKKGSATSPKFNIEPENGFQKESAFPGFHVNQYPQNAKSRNFPQKNPPLPSGCCDFFSSSLVFCKPQKKAPPRWRFNFLFISLWLKGCFGLVMTFHLLWKSTTISGHSPS